MKQQPNNKLTVKNESSKPSDFLLELSNLMNNIEFRLFFDKYFNDWDEIKAVLMFMKTYQFINYEYKKNFDTPPSPKKMSTIMRNMMNDTECRGVLVKSMDTFINVPNRSISSETAIEAGADVDNSHSLHYYFYNAIKDGSIA